MANKVTIECYMNGSLNQTLNTKNYNLYTKYYFDNNVAH